MLPREVFLAREKVIDKVVTGDVPTGNQIELDGLLEIVGNSIRINDLRYVVCQLQRGGLLSARKDKVVFPKVVLEKARKVIEFRTDLEQVLGWNLLLTTPEGIAGLEAKVVDLTRAADNNREVDFTRIDARFHSQLPRGIGFCNNRELIQDASDKLRIFWSNNPLDAGIQRGIIENHQFLISAIREQNPVGIVGAITRQSEVYGFS